MERSAGTRRARDDLALVRTPRQGALLLAAGAILIVFPFVGTPFQIDLASQVFLTSIGALALMLLTGFAGLISLGTAGLLAAGAFTVGILVRAVAAPFWVTLPSAAVLGAVMGLVFGLPSLRLRGLYLAISTLGLHFIVVFLGSEYETQQTLSTGLMVPSPGVGSWQLQSGRGWYFMLLAFALLALLVSLNLRRSRTGRAWRALRQHDVVAAALGVDVQSFKLLAFVISAAMTAAAGALFAYFRNFVSIDAFSLYLTIQYLAMIIIGGMGSLAGALLGAVFVTLFPYLIDWAAQILPASFSNTVFALEYAAFGLVMILFLLFEPSGLMGVLQRLRNLTRPRQRRPGPAVRSGEA